MPELNPAGRAIFLGDRAGVGFDASNKVVRLAVVSQDNGACDVFMGDADNAKVLSMLEGVLGGTKNSFTREGVTQDGKRTSTIYKMTIGGHVYTLVASLPSEPVSAIKAILTLTP